MKTKAIIILLIFLNFGCSSGSKIFSTGEVVIKNDIEVLDIKIINDLPLCRVSIQGNEYNFLVDTGAPMVISDELFAKLNLKKAYSATVGDSQKKKKTQDFCVLPEIIIGNLVFKNIGAVVLTIDNQELKCFGFDGIIGSNLLAKLHWQFDFQNNKISATKNLALFNTDQSDFSLNFTNKAQKTPYIAGKVNNKMLDFTFDTGYGGNIKVANDLSYHQNSVITKDFVTKSGINAIGVYGNSESDVTFVMKSDLFLGDSVFNNEIIDSGSSTLIGNEFLKDYVFVIDWTKNQIHFKKNLKLTPKKLDGFGFGYLFVNGKAEVISRVENKSIPIEIGDQILSINDTDFTKIQNSEICDYFLNKVEKNETEITVLVKRGDETLEFNLTRQDFIK